MIEFNLFKKMWEKSIMHEDTHVINFETIVDLNMEFIKRLILSCPNNYSGITAHKCTYCRRIPKLAGSELVDNSQKPCLVDEPTCHESADTPEDKGSSKQLDENSSGDSKRCDEVDFCPSCQPKTGTSKGCGKKFEHPLAYTATCGKGTICKSCQDNLKCKVESDTCITCGLKTCESLKEENGTCINCGQKETKYVDGKYIIHLVECKKFEVKK